MRPRLEVYGAFTHHDYPWALRTDRMHRSPDVRGNNYWILPIGLFMKLER